jgi:glycosyltransferase involved in cell wall biosynthesis
VNHLNREFNSTLIVIPASNEKAVLGRILDALLQKVPNNQVLVVGDVSIEKTSQIMLDRKISLLELPFNLDVGAAMRSGFQYAKENGR